MDVINALMELIKAAPELAIYILLILYGFKVVVVGSIYGVIRYVADAIRDTIVRTAEAKSKVVHVVELRNKMGNVQFINGTENLFYDFIAELRQLTPSTRSLRSEYVHDDDIRAARELIRAAKDKLKD